MIPRLNISFTIQSQFKYWFGKEYEPKKGELLLNHARSAIAIALRSALPPGMRVGVMAYNCHTVANSVVEAGCVPVYVDVTEHLEMDLNHLMLCNVDAVVVTHLFGIKNDIARIRQLLPNAVIIVDNAHGCLLPKEGDFTVYSIGQGKLPSVGDGGMLCVNNEKFLSEATLLYDKCDNYALAQEFLLYLRLLAKAIIYKPIVYRFAMHWKSIREQSAREKCVIKKMSKGVSRVYRMQLATVKDKVCEQHENAKHIVKLIEKWGGDAQPICGTNAFMLVVRTKAKDSLSHFLWQRGIETATHFSNCTKWAEEFGYKRGACPNTEMLVEELLMIPTYKSVNR